MLAEPDRPEIAMNLLNAEFDLLDKSSETLLKTGLASMAALLVFTGALLYLHANTLIG